MPSKKHKTQGEAPVQGRWLYDFVMRGIEPDLLLEEKELDERYKGETPISHAARMHRYKQAFAEYDRVIGLVAASLVEAAQKEKTKRRKVAGLEESKQRSAEANAIEQSLDSFGSDV
ncbi:MAG: hypothetical protein AAB544_04200 [Patescibacteria group bacterium]